jgi:hypothetical protein
VVVWLQYGEIALISAAGVGAESMAQAVVNWPIFRNVVDMAPNRIDAFKETFQRA